MEDKQIIELYFERSEKAINETNRKYGKYCNNIAFNILQNKEDSNECVNDTYLNVWNAIPPQRPNIFRLFLGKITRNLAFKKYEKRKAKKRTDNVEVVLEELQECVSNNSIEQTAEYEDLVASINRFLAEISEEKRRMFLDRYWYLYSIKDIALKHNISESNVKVTLLRIREQLKNKLKEDGLYE